LKDSVTCLIKATIHHTIPAKDELPADLPITILGYFLDLDLAILASSAEEYEEYSSRIRQEYVHVCAEDYREGRSKVLRKFLERDKLFFGDNKDMDEAQARLNLAAEINALGWLKDQKE
jgi:predicted metal-dependent HD superfamily phosphohydrolase